MNTPTKSGNRVFAVNVNGAFYMIRAALPALRRSRGVIVNVSSMTALVGQDRGAAYVASKGALVSMTKALALELAPDGIRVNCVCPAGVDTPLLRILGGTLPDPEAVLRGQAEMHLLKTAGDSRRHRLDDRLPRLARSLVHHRDDPAGRGRGDARLSAS